IELEPDPFVICNVGPGLVASVWVFPAEPVEFPVRIGEVLDRALVARGGRGCLTATERTQIDGFEARPAVNNAVCQADERPRVRQTLSVQTAQNVDLNPSSPRRLPHPGVGATMTAGVRHDEGKARSFKRYELGTHRFRCPRAAATNQAIVTIHWNGGCHT